MSLLKIILFISFIISSSSWAAILIDEGDSSESSATSSEIMEENHSNTSFIESDEFSMNESSTQSHFGMGLKFSGEVGAAGFHGEARIIDDIAVGASYGFGTGYQTLGLRAIQYLSEGTWSFYGLGGFTKWFSSKSSKKGIQESNPDFLVSRFLNSDERKTGSFSETLIYPGIGLKYGLGQGDLAGMAFQAELILLTDIDDLRVALTGSLGAIYYF